MWRNHNRAKFYYDLLVGITTSVSPTNYFPDFANMWFAREAQDIIPPIYFWTYDDYAVLNEGRVNAIDYDTVPGIRAEMSYTSTLPTYSTYGYDINLDTTIGGNTTHGTPNNYAEYVSPSTVFEKTVISGDYVKIECPISSYRTEASDPPPGAIIFDNDILYVRSYIIYCALCWIIFTYISYYTLYTIHIMLDNARLYIRFSTIHNVYYVG